MYHIKVGNFTARSCNNSITYRRKRKRKTPTFLLPITYTFHKPTTIRIQTFNRKKFKTKRTSVSKLLLYALSKWNLFQTFTASCLRSSNLLLWTLRGELRGSFREADCRGGCHGLILRSQLGSKRLTVVHFRVCWISKLVSIIGGSG